MFNANVPGAVLKKEKTKKKGAQNNISTENPFQSEA
jgi:hypothetical protein